MVNENEPEVAIEVMGGGFRCRNRENHRRKGGGKVRE